MDREDWNRKYDTDDFVWDVHPNRFLEAELRDMPPGRALDVACGEGRNAVWLASRGWRVTGVDFSDVAVAKARRLAEANGVTVDWVVADVLEHEPEAGTYDLVVVMYLQLPAAERDEALRRARRALRPGGTFLLVAHDRSNLDGGWGGPQDPAVLTTPAEVVAALPGVTVEKAEVVTRYVEAEGATHEAYDTLVRAVAAP